MTEIDSGGTKVSLITAMTENNISVKIKHTSTFLSTYLFQQTDNITTPNCCLLQHMDECRLFIIWLNHGHLREINNEKGREIGH